jgi:predicted amidohydrolase
MRLLTVAIILATADSRFAPDQATPKQDGHLRMALVSIRSLFSDSPDAKANQANIDANLKRHVYFIEKLAADGADFVGFPELSLNGYHFSKSMTWLSIDGPEVKMLQKIAADKGLYVSAGLALQDAERKRWNAQIVIGPEGRIIALQKKIQLTKEKGFTEVGSEYQVFDVKGIKMGIAICADGSDQKNLKNLVDNGAQLIYGPHANSTGGTTAGWYKFRSNWAGPDGWIAQFKVYAALHNHAAHFNPEFAPSSGSLGDANFASGAWFIGPDGKTLAQMPSSSKRADSKEYVLMYSVPLPRK